VAVGAQQDALSRLLARVSDTPRSSVARQPESLLSTVYVVELQCGDTAAIATDAAAPARLLDEDPLEPSTAVGDVFLAAELAPVGSTWIEPEADQPVLRAGAICQ
jgi:hypothetical protein